MSVSTSGTADPLLVNEIIRVVQSQPKWDKPKNPAVDEPFTTGVTVKFKLPDQISCGMPPIVVVEEDASTSLEEMVSCSGFIKNNIKYPEAAKAEKIEGRVIVRVCYKYRKVRLKD
ncbi:MAG: hypothetical protein MZU84_07770 [Sphingobacterium sp.]|nr:hypothetical protein [Sphingobacterium sp.]